VSAANAPGAAGNSSRILAMLWHSPYEFVVSGGFRRTQEILKRVPACIEVLAIDSSPTMLEETGSLKVIEYRFPAWIRRLDRRFFFAIRLLEWFCALASMVAVCVRLWMRGERFDAVYVPSSDNTGARRRHIREVPVQVQARPVQHEHRVLSPRRAAPSRMDAQPVRPGNNALDGPRAVPAP
jgi:hypothetical protein